MSPTTPSDIPPAAAQVVEKRSRGLSLVWVVPVVAALIGAWLWYSTVSNRGPLVSMTFETADGIQAGKTKIKLKNVDVGVVESIDISDDLSRVLLRGRFSKRAEPHLRELTRFWVVRPRIGAQGISGLGTLISGAYIAMEPGEGAPAYEFAGIELPPVSPNDAPGLKLKLQSDRLASVGVGSSVYFRDVCVGLVEGHDLAVDGKSVMIHVYIEEQFAGLVRTNSRFWNASGIDVSLGADGVDIRTAALDAILTGGISFESPSNEALGPSATSGSEYWLHPDWESVTERIYTETDEYVLYFDGSVRGLSVGAPVEFRGIKMGKVTEVVIQYDTSSQELLIPVHIEIQRGRVEILGDDDDTFGRDQAIQAFVERGLRAQLQTGSLVTGALFVDLDFYPNAPARLLNINPEESELPTIPSTGESLENTLAQFPQLVESAQDAIEAFEALVTAPGIFSALDGVNLTLEDMRTTLDTLDQRLASLSTDVSGTTDAATEAFQQVASTFDSLRETTAQDSETLFELNRALGEIAESARSLRSLTEYLEQHPESLLGGKQEP